MIRFRRTILGLLLAAGAAVATPSAAFTYVHFSFNAGATPVLGVFTLDCPAGAGPCAIVAISGMFGATAIALAQPPYAANETPPDNLLTRPDYQPTGNGGDFWPDIQPSEETWKFWKQHGEQLAIEQYEKDQVAFVQEYLVTDYRTYVPEPQTWTLMLAGFFGLGAALRRRRAAQRA